MSDVIFIAPSCDFILKKTMREPLTILYLVAETNGQQSTSLHKYIKHEVNYYKVNPYDTLNKTAALDNHLAIKRITSKFSFSHSFHAWPHELKRKIVNKNIIKYSKYNSNFNVIPVKKISSIPNLII